MTSYTNPDVDRVSLDRRVSALEDKFGISGPGGGSGGGAGGGSGGGSSPIILGAIDFDQYPDNSWTEDREGLIFKMSIDDFPAIGATILPGFSLKICGILPKIYQYPWFGGLPSTLFARCQYNQDLTLPSTGAHQFNFSKTINWTPWFDFFNKQRPANRTQLLNLVINCCSPSNKPTIPGTGGLGFALYFEIFSDNFIRISLRKISVELYPDFISFDFGASQGIGFGACNYSYINADWMFIRNTTHSTACGDVTCGWGIGWNPFVKKLNQLPSIFKQIYPKSWVS